MNIKEMNNMSRGAPKSRPKPKSRLNPVNKGKKCSLCGEKYVTHIGSLSRFKCTFNYELDLVAPFSHWYKETKIVFCRTCADFIIELLKKNNCDIDMKSECLDLRQGE
jgi:hypothetical protein